jgi:hypothetical protein
MKFKESEKTIKEFETKTICGKTYKDTSKKRLKHNIEMHQSFCEKCKEVKNGSKKNRKGLLFKKLTICL